MKVAVTTLSTNGFSLIELVTAAAIVGIVAAMIIPTYSAYRMRVQRLNAKSCLLHLARQQELYFVRHNHYVTDLKILGYNASSSVTCADTDQYRLTSSLVEAADCSLSRCYQLSAIPQGAQKEDGALYITYDSSQTDTSQRFKKERGQAGSGKTWN